MFNLLFFLKTIGQGGFGRIFQAKHVETSNIVAIKERIKDNLIEEWEKEIQFMKDIEKRVPSLNKARFICSLDDTSRNIEKKYIVLEWIEGKNLKNFSDVINTKNIEDKEIEILRMMFILMNELKKLHDCGMLHRDIKTENLMCYKKGNQINYLLIDFGSSSSVENKNRIKTFSIEFSSPEQNTENESYKSDVFSLGTSFLKVLISCKLDKNFSEINKILLLMTKKNMEERVSLDESIEMLHRHIKSKIEKNLQNQFEELKTEEKFFVEDISSFKTIIENRIYENKSSSGKFLFFIDPITCLISSKYNEIKTIKYSQQNKTIENITDKKNFVKTNKILSPGKYFIKLRTKSKDPSKIIFGKKKNNI